MSTTHGMVLVLALLTAVYAVVVLRVLRPRHAALATGEAPELPAEDQPPPTAVGWPPGGPAFTAYVDEGFQALDAYLSEGFAT